MTDSLMGLGPTIAWARRWIGCVAMLGLLAPVATGAAELAEPDARAVRKVVEAQLDAFAMDDAERAFSYASASIRARLGDAATFMAMVRGGYPMVVRPAAVSFFLPQADDGAEGAAVTLRQTVRQNVQLRDRDGRLWLASYLLERQAGAGWRIDGCVVVSDNGKSLT
jgi:hypothetical protein